MNVVVSVEARRGCGYRSASKGGIGIYLVGPSASKPCGRIPFPLSSCPCCGGGIKPARGFTWIEPRVLFAPTIQPRCRAQENMGDRGALICSDCPMGAGIPDGRHGLIWIGEKFYKTPADFKREADMMGVSRKIGKVPRDFVLGETWVYLGHRRAVPIYDDQTGETTAEPGVFTAFLPTGIDLVIENEHDVPEQAERLAETIAKKAKGGDVRLVKVVPEQQADIEQPGDRGA
jgi:hypothetical protein